MPLAESRRQQKASKTISIIAYLAFFTNSFLKPDRFCRIPMILWGLYAGLYLQKPIVWARLRPGVPFFGASHPFRRPFSRSISGGSHRPAHKNSRAFSSFLCTALAFFPRSCYTTHEVASFKPMLQVCICALLPMQPYTPHGDSNPGQLGFRFARPDATLYPARGQQYFERWKLDDLKRMQPYTPHGDSNFLLNGTQLGPDLMQPYTPHGDSNKLQAIEVDELDVRMQPYTPHGDSNSTGNRPPLMMCSMQPYTPHGDSNARARPSSGRNKQMQPYTPHGDSNHEGEGRPRPAARCNLIPRTGTATPMISPTSFAYFDATLYPARGQQP